MKKKILKPHYYHGKRGKTNSSDQNWFTKATLNAAFNDNPAVMTASGWDKDSRGNWKQKRTAATDKLADNLEIISMLADGKGGMAGVKDIGKLAWNTLRHPIRTLKQVKALGALAKDVISNGVKKAGKSAVKVARRNKTLRKVVKQVTAKKRVDRALKTLQNRRSQLNQRTNRLSRISNAMQRQRLDANGKTTRFASQQKIIDNKTTSREQTINWGKMKIDDANKLSQKLGNTKHLKPVKVRVTTNGKTKEIIVPGVENGADLKSSVNTGSYNVPDFETGATTSGTLDISRPSLSERSVPIEMPTGDRVEILRTDLENHSLVKPRIVSGNDDLRKAVQQNIEYVKKEIPGFKPFGSSVGEAEGAIVHNTHDIDGYITRDMLAQLQKKNLVSTTTPGETYLYKVQNGKFGEAGNVDLNILSIDKDGKIGNSRTAEMYRQFYPLEYQKQARELAGSRAANGDFSGLKALDANGNVLTEQQLLDSYDPLVKTIMDSGEIDFTNPNKAKHAGRFLEYLAGDNTEAVHRALDLESKRAGALGHLLPKMNFYSPEENVKLLQKIGFTGDVGTVANDPNKMQNVLDYWFLSARRNYRAVNAGDYRGGNESIGNLMRNLTDWNASGVNTGGYYSGFGLNTTIDGTSGLQRTIDAYIQPHIPGLSEMTDPNEIIDTINHSYGIGLSTKEKQQIAAALGSTYDSTHPTYNSQDLLQQLPASGETTKQKLQKISRDFGINSFTGNPYMGSVGSNYSGISRTLDPSTDAIGTMLSRDANPIMGTASYPSWSLRMNNNSTGAWSFGNQNFPRLRRLQFTDYVEDPILEQTDRRINRMYNQIFRINRSYNPLYNDLIHKQSTIQNNLRHIRDIGGKVKIAGALTGYLGSLGGAVYFGYPYAVGFMNSQSADTTIDMLKSQYLRDYDSYKHEFGDLMNEQSKKLGQKENFDRFYTPTDSENAPRSIIKYNPYDTSDTDNEYYINYDMLNDYQKSSREMFRKKIN